MRKFFGTDGIRGKANIYPMTCEVAMILGRAVTHYFQKERRFTKPIIVIGKDTRLSCYMLEQAFSSGVCAQGGRAILTGPLPTPGVAFVVESMRADAGVMISASHNEFSDNGIKIFDSEGQKLPDEVELELEKMILSPDLIPVKIGGELGNAKRLDEVIGRYIVQVKSAFPSHYDLEGMRIVIDCANGAGYRVAPQVLQELGAEVFPLGTEPNGQNINSYCGSLHPEKCAQAVLKYRADLGVCLDGDGDRCVIVDENGQIIEGDKIIGMLAKFLKRQGKLGDKDSRIVGTVMTNIGLERFLKDLGISLVRTKVGDRYIYEYMNKHNLIFGGEPSGHIIFKQLAKTGDGLLAALKVIECCKFFDRGLSELAKEVTLYPQVLKNIEVKEKPHFDTLGSLQSCIKESEKRLGEKGRVLLRYSGTEPKARIMVEGEDRSLIYKICDELASAVIKEIG